MTYGSILHDVRAAQTGDVDAEIIDLRTIDSQGLDFARVAESIRRTHRAVIVEQAPFLGAPGAQLADRIQRELFDELDAPVNRVASVDVPLPVSRRLERAVLPCIADIRDAILATVDGREWTKVPRDPDSGEEEA
jgi:pyruvate/2-oxoglutarate/acetoin dehydrogenase E1 component